MFAIPTSSPVLSSRRRKAPTIGAVLGTACFGALPASAHAQTVVVPSALATTEGSIYNNINEAITEQQLIPASLLGSIPLGSSITGVAFRFDSAQVAINSTIDFSNFDVYLGGSTVSSLSSGQSFTANEGVDTVEARSGSLSFAANAFPSGGSPNAFGPMITFTTPYTYTGGNLLFTFSSSAPSVDFRLDADQSSASAGNYAMQAGGYNAAVSDYAASSTSEIPEFQFSGAAAAPEPGSLVLLTVAAVPLLPLNKFLRPRRPSGRQA